MTRILYVTVLAIGIVAFVLAGWSLSGLQRLSAAARPRRRQRRELAPRAS